MTTPWKIVPGLILCTRSQPAARHLRAFLAHHMRLCVRGVVVVDCRSEQEWLTSEVRALLLAEYPGRVEPIPVISELFDNVRTIEVLREHVADQAWATHVLHMDQDEFLSDRVDVQAVVDTITSGACDCASAWMACRLGPGVTKYSAELPDYASFRRAAPVRAEARKNMGCCGTKIWLTRAPWVMQHFALDGARVHPRMFALDHFWYTDHRYKDAADKLAVRRPVAELLATLETAAEQRSEPFVRAAHASFQPISSTFQGWFDYPDVYRAIAKWIPPGSTFVELGVFRGKSLGYMAEYMTLLGKRARLVGVDAFATSPGKDVHKHAFATPEDMRAHLSSRLADVAPWNPPELMVEDSAAAASAFADGSVDALWIDADHSFDAVVRDIEAWRPKLRPGAILAGHDLSPDYPGVAAALQHTGLQYRKVSRRSWMARGSGYSFIAT